MGREKFIYNTQTLRYEKVEVSLKEQLLKAFGFLCAVAVTGVLFTLLVWKFFPSPKEAYVRWELNTMEPGESMWVAPEDARSAKQAVRQRAKALGVNEFIVQKLEWGSSYRITRLEPPQLRGLRSHGGG